MVCTTSREADILVTESEHRGNMPTPRQKLKFQMLLVFTRKIYGQGNPETVLPLYITSFVSMVIPTHSEQTFFPLSNKEVEHEAVSYITDLGQEMQWEAEPGELWGTPSVMRLLPVFSRACEHLTPPRDYPQMLCEETWIHHPRLPKSWVTRNSSNNWLWQRLLDKLSCLEESHINRPAPKLSKISSTACKLYSDLQVSSIQEPWWVSPS